MYTLKNRNTNENLKVELVPTTSFSQTLSDKQNNPELFQICLISDVTLNRQQGFITLSNTDKYDLLLNNTILLTNSSSNEIFDYLNNHTDIKVITPKNIEYNGIEVSYKR